LQREVKEGYSFQTLTARHWQNPEKPVGDGIFTPAEKSSYRVLWWRDRVIGVANRVEFLVSASSFGRSEIPHSAWKTAAFGMPPSCVHRCLQTDPLSRGWNPGLPWQWGASRLASLARR